METAAGDDFGTTKHSQRGGRRTGAGRKRKSGGDRPTTFTEAIGLEICERLIAGETLDAICRDAHMPKSRVTVFRWRQANDAFNAAYLEARGDQMDALVDQVIEIAETEKDIQRAKVKLDARRIALARLAPRYAAGSDHRPEQPLDLAGAIEANRKRIEALVAEVGQDRAERMRQEQIINAAVSPRAGTSEAVVRGHQRVAMDILEQRKKALLDATNSDTSMMN